MPQALKSFKDIIIVVGMRKGAIDGMPSNLQLRAFKKFDNFKKWVDSMKFDVFGPKSFFEELAKVSEARFSADEFCFVVKLNGKCKNFYIDFLLKTI